MRAPRYDSELPYLRVFRGGKTERILLDPIRSLDRSGDCSPGDTASEPEVQGYGRPGSGPSGRVRDLSAWGIAPSEKFTRTHSDPELGPELTFDNLRRRAQIFDQFFVYFVTGASLPELDRAQESLSPPELDGRAQGP